MLKKPLFLILLILLTLTLAHRLPQVLAATTRQDRIETAFPENDLNLDQYANENTQGVITMLGDAIIPFTTEDGRNLNTGAVPAIGKGIAFLTTSPPVNSGDYLADVLKNTKLMPQAYAQGIGFSSLTPVLSLWKAFRNMAFFIYIVIFLVVGFMVMFRAQVDHQTIVTVQLALPKLILTLVLITFSYAIAGFVVDLIYLTIFFATGLLQNFGILLPNTGAIDARNAVFGFSIFRIALKYFVLPGEAAGGAANGVAAVITGMLGISWLDFLADALAYLIIAVAILIATFRTFFALLMAYIGIILATIFAPIQLLLNAVPGQNTFSNWLKGLVANAAVFPAVVIMLLIGAYLVGDESNPPLGINPTDQAGGFGPGYGQKEGSGFVPPLITTRARAGSTEEFGVEHIKAIIGLGFIMLLPEVGKIVKKSFGVEDSGLGEMAFQNFAKGWTPYQRMIQAAQTTAKEREAEKAQARALALGMGRPSPAIPRMRRDEMVLKWLRNILGV